MKQIVLDCNPYGHVSLYQVLFREKIFIIDELMNFSPFKSGRKHPPPISFFRRTEIQKTPKQLQQKQTKKKWLKAPEHIK